MIKPTVLRVFLCFCTFLAAANPLQKNKVKSIMPFTVSFTENKGQVSDQHHQARKDVLFGVQGANFSFHIREGGVSYQLYRVRETEDKSMNHQSEDVLKEKLKKAVPEKIEAYRLDVNWINANKNIVIAKKHKLAGSLNFYLEGCGEGVTDVSSFEELILKNLYDEIDLRYYGVGGQIKYDYIVSPGADYKKINLQIKGTEKISISSNGDLLIKTPFGIITEKAPQVFQAGLQLKARWVVSQQNLSFDITGVDKTKELIIDPLIRLWGTYYGGSGYEYGYGTCTDKLGNSYLTGLTILATSTVIATSGAHQTTYGGGLNSSDAFLVKFNSAGVRQWGTYYGGTGSEVGEDCVADTAGNIILAGYTESISGTVIATPGTHQPSINGYANAMLVKFNTNGTRIWGTYYGGTGSDTWASSCVTDKAGNIYITGYTGSTQSSALTSSACHQPTFGGAKDAFVAKFSATGQRIWGTYYGDVVNDYGHSCALDTAGNLYVAGQTASWGYMPSMATAASHQSVAAGSNDAFLVKFNNSGVRQWATFFGGYGFDMAYSCATDISGNVYMAGYTYSDTGSVISTTLAHQPLYGGPTDAFLVKFNSSGQRQWGTYYGGSNVEIAYECMVDLNSDVYLTGITTSSNAIATTGAYKTNQSNPNYHDVFLAKFSSSGIRYWGTYYGDFSEDNGFSGCTDLNGSVLICGSTLTQTGTAIVSPGAHQTSGIGYSAFLVKFHDCNPLAAPVVSTVSQNIILCAGNSATMVATHTSTVHWYSSPVATNSLAAGQQFVTPTLSPGTYTYYAGAVSPCTLSASRSPVNITVSALPQLTVNSGTICSGQLFTITPAGATTYTVTGGNFIVSPPINSSYSVSGTSSAGCISTAIAVSDVSVFALPFMSAFSDKSVICVGQAVNLIAQGAQNYSWTNGPSTSSYSLVPNATALYTVTGVDANGCQATATLYVIVNTCTNSDKDNLSEALSIYPNPASDFIQIRCDYHLNFSLFDASGRLVLTDQTDSNGSVDIRHLAKGLYLLRVEQNGKPSSHRFIKE